MSAKKTVNKNVTQFSFSLSNQEWDTVKRMGKVYNSVRNDIFAAYSGIHSLTLSNDNARFRAEVRDPISGKDGYGSRFKIPARMRNLALEDARANIQSEWSNTKNRVRTWVRENSNLNNEDKHYIYTTLISNQMLEDILCRRPVTRPESVKNLEIDEYRIHNLIRRYIRKAKGKVAHSSSTTFKIDPDLYEYKTIDGILYLCFATPKRGKRITVKVCDHQVHTGTLTIKLNESTHTLEIHALKKVNTRKANSDSRKSRQTIGVDKGYRDLLASSSDKFYGVGIGKLMSDETEEQNTKLKKRNKIWAQMQDLIKNGEVEKAERIRKNNFGRKKWNRKRTNAKEHLKSEINHAIRIMIKEENPNRLVLEKLSFQSWHKKLPGKVKRKLTRWVKGYLDERLVYICDLFQVETVHINPAYTSQTCSVCGCLGERNGDKFSCPHCGFRGHADLNAGKTIKQRYTDEEITLFTPYTEVKKILLTRTAEYDKAHN